LLLGASLEPLIGGLAVDALLVNARDQRGGNQLLALLGSYRTDLAAGRAYPRAFHRHGNALLVEA